MLLLFTGPNDFTLKQALDELIATFLHTSGIHAIERVSGDECEPSHMAELLQSVSLFAAERLIILRDAGKNKPVWEALADWCDRVPQGTTLVVVEPTPDKRTKTYKQLVKYSDIRIFEELSEKELLAWVERIVIAANGSIDTRIADYLIQRIGKNQWHIWQEVQKLLATEYPITKELIDGLVEASSQTSVFEVLDAVLDHKAEKVVNLLKVFTIREDPYRFFGLLIAQIQALATVFYATRSSDTIAKDSGLHPFVIRKALTQAHNIDAKQLTRIVNVIALCDMQLKSTTAEPWFLVEQCLRKITA